jgi:hypothetical protein
MEFAVSEAVEKINNQTEDHPETKAKPILPAELGHKVGAAHDTQDRYQRKPLNKAQYCHQEGEDYKSKIWQSLKENSRRGSHALLNIFG